MNRKKIYLDEIVFIVSYTFVHCTFTLTILGTENNKKQ